MHKKISEIINKNFYSFWKAANSDKYLYHVLKGGRASAKSTHIAIWLVLALMKNPVTCLCIRKVAGTLAESVFEQLKEAIDILGVNHLWKIRKSPLKLTYIPRGNSFIFRGADDPAKIKSIKMSKFPITYLWIEELAEFKTEDEVSMIVNSVLRAELEEGLNYKVFYSYNPPKRKQSWVNKKYNTQFISDNTYVHHSTYLENTHISKAFMEEAEEVKKKNEFKYRWEYLGEPIGSGVVPFNNLVFRTITDNEANSFDNIRQGNDWGYATDPVAFVKLHYDKTRKRIFFIDEFYGVKKSNRELANWIINKEYQYDMTICDSAEPKSVDELKSYNVTAKGAKKGPGSVEYGEKWLDDLDEIVIDVKRTPNTAREFENIDYQVDKDGNTKAKLEDKDNHTIDATRYALEDDMKSRRIKGPVNI
ncbi:MAG TPA: PBSX family phage terminase large subunit [Terrisporobacter glycolicus]|uniref:PBSX family phage terminase large subunit n=1 Tax=Terrisporobacter TaxID=1505652 RepID=UPI000E881618|nr:MULTISPECIES: PBSX family phage terminase large subunit [Terrisporobacter]HBI91493.1 PBSX family phage terminase large subunit [Terrisporobacter hibernicus]